MLLRLQSGSEALGFRDSLNFDCYCIHCRFDPLEPAADRAQLFWRQQSTVSARSLTANELHLSGPECNLAADLWRLHVSVRPMALCLIVLGLTAACETTTDPIFGDPGGGGAAITQAQAAGDWSFTVRPNTTLPCTGGSLADGTVLLAHFDVLGDGTLNAATSIWQNPPTAVVRPLSGSVRLTDGFADAFFSSSSGSTSAMELRGTITTTATFSGTLTDPAPGFSPIFSVSGCQYNATGTKA